MRALAQGGYSRLDENKPDDTAVRDNKPTLAFIHTFRRALYDPGLLLQEEFQIGRKIAVKDMRFDKLVTFATGRRTYVQPFLLCGPEPRHKDGHMLAATERRWQWGIKPERYAALEHKICEWQNSKAATTKFSKFKRIVQSVFAI